MACTYHQQYDAARLACVQTRAVLINFGPATVMNIFNNGAINLVNVLNTLDGMRQAITIFLNSTELPPRPPIVPGDDSAWRAWRRERARTQGRRASAKWQQRLAALQNLINILRQFGVTAWPGQGGLWF